MAFVAIKMGRRPLSSTTLRAVASWQFYPAAAARSRRNQIWALRSRLEIQPTCRGESQLLMGHYTGFEDQPQLDHLRLPREKTRNKCPKEPALFVTLLSEKTIRARVRVWVGTRKGAFILTADGQRNEWEVSGPHFAGWEIYHVNGSPVNPNRLYASQNTSWFGQMLQRSDDGGQTWEAVGNEFKYDGVPGTHKGYDGNRASVGIQTRLASGTS